MALSEYCIGMLEADGYYWVHNLQKCDDLHLPAPENRAVLGHHYTPDLALEKAREFVANVKLCPHCCGGNGTGSSSTTAPIRSRR